MSDAAIDKLAMDIETKAGKTEDIDKLTASIAKLRAAAVPAAASLSSLSRALSELNSVLAGLKGKTASLSSLSANLRKLAAMNVSAAGSGLRQFAASVRALSRIGTAMASIKSFGKGISSLVRSLRKIKTADMTGVAAKVREMAAALRPLTDEMIRAGRGALNYGRQIRDLAAALDTLQRAQSGGAQISGQSEGGGGGGGFSLSGILSYVYNIRRAGEAIGAAIGSMNTYVKDVNMFTSAMGEFAGEGRRFAASMELKLGLDSGEVMQSIVQFRQLGAAFGVTSGQAFTMSKNLTQLGYDLSSLYGMSSEESFSMLQSGMSGEAGPMSGIGVDLSAARLQQELYAMGIDRTVDSLSQADAALLRYTAIMQQTGNVQSNMAKTLEAPANALRVLQAQISITVRWIGAVFIPALSGMLSWVIAFVKATGEIARSVAQAFGFEIPEIKMPVESGGKLDPVKEEIGSVGDSAKAAKKNVDALIGGFDEMHILNQNDSPEAGGAGSTGGAGGDVLSGIELPEYDVFDGLIKTDIAEKAAKLKGPLEEIFKIAAAVGIAFLSWKIAKSLFDGFGMISSILNNLRTASKGMTFAGLGSSMTSSLGSLWKTASQLAPAIGKAAPVAAGVAATIGFMVWRFLDLYQNSESFRKGLSRVWEIIVMVKNTVEDLISYFKDLAVNAGKWILSFLPEDVQKLILNVLGKIQDFISGMGLGVADFGITAVGFGLLFTPAAPFGAALLIFEEITLIIRAIGSISDETWEKIKVGIQARLDLITKMVKAFFSKEFWVGLFNSIKDAALGVWEGIKTDLDNNKTQMIASVEALKDRFVELWETIKTRVFEAWESVRSSTVTKWEEIKTAISDAIGSIKEFIFVTLPEIINSVVLWFTELPEKIAYALGFALGKIVQWATELHETISTAIPQIIDSVVNFFITLPGRVYEAVCGLGERLMLWGEETWLALTTQVSAIVDGAVLFFTELPSKVYAAIITIKDSLLIWGADTLTAIREEASKIVDGAVAKFTELGGKAYAAICTFKDKIIQFGQNAIAWFGAELPKVINSVVEWFKTLPQKITEAIASMKEKIINIGKNILAGIFEGLANIKEKLSSWKENFVQGFKDALGIKSPSTIMRDEVGVYLASGVAEGLNQGTSEIVAEAENIAQAVQHVFEGISYSMDTDYTALRNDAIKEGDYETANRFETIRRAKIQGEGMSYALDDDMSLLLQDMGAKTDVSNETLASIRDLNTAANETDTLRYESSLIQSQTDTEKLHEFITGLSEQWKGTFDKFTADWRTRLSAIKSEIGTAARDIVASTDKIRINIYNSYGGLGAGSGSGSAAGSRGGSGSRSRAGSGEIDVFAAGGFPTQGSMFIANEAGPELVGTLGNRPAVVNNAQIVESVSEGVAEAVGRAMRQYGQAAENRTIIELDGDVIYDSNKKVEQRRGYNFGLGAFAR